MKFSIPAAALAKAIAPLVSLCSTKITIPVLANLRVTVTPTGVAVRGTNTMVDLTVDLRAAEDLERGAVLINAKRLSTLLGGITDTDVVTVISTKDGEALIQTANSRTTLKSEPLAEFPIAKPTPEGHAIVVGSSSIIELLKQVAPTTTLDDTRYQLAAISLAVEGDRLVAKSSDGYRCTVASVPVTVSGAVTTVGILPKVSISAVMAAMATDEDVAIYPTDTDIVFVSGGRQCHARHADGHLPALDRIIAPLVKLPQVAMLRLDLAAAVRRCLAADEQTGQVAGATLTFSTDGVEVSASTTVGSTKSTLAFDAPSRQAFPAKSVNGHFLLGALNVMTSDRVLVRSADDFGGLVLEQPVGERTDYFFLVMPIRN